MNMSKNELRELARLSLHEPLYWVTEHDACFDYCYKCASKVAIGMSEILGQEVLVDGGSWASGEGESPKFCIELY